MEGVLGVDDWGMLTWGQLADPLLSTLKLSIEKEVHFGTLNKFLVPNLEWLLSKESLKRVGLSRLLGGGSGNPIPFLF